STAGENVGLTGIYYWDDVWWYGSSNSLYQGSTNISNGTYDGNRITFLSAAPTAGVADYLFVVGGSTQTLRKIDSAASKTVTAWGLTPPPSVGYSATSGGSVGGLTSGTTYKYRFTYYNSETGTRSNPTPVPSTTAASTATVLLISATGAHNSTVTADTGPTGHTIATTGSCVVSTGVDDPFSGDNGALQCPTAADLFYAPNHADFGYSTAPFTIEFFTYLKDVSQDVGFMEMFASTTDFYSIAWDQGESKLRFYCVQGGTPHQVNISGDWSPSTGQWYHIAFVRGWDGVSDRAAITVDGSTLTTALKVISPGSVVPVMSGAVLRFGRACVYSSAAGGSYTTGQEADAYFSQIHIAKEALWTEPFTPGTSVRYGTVGLTAASKSIAISGLVAATDTQVTHHEIWRTQGNGTSYFLVERIDEDDTTYTDITADTELGIEELQTDNLKPYYWFDDAVYHNASMFWLTRTRAGERGRVYYSPIGRSEAVQGFINVADDAEPLKRFVKYGTGLGVFSEDGFYEILGENPYYSRRVPGVPGTVEPFSVVITPYGIAYEAADGPRLLTGTQAIPLGDDTVDILFQGSTAGGLTAFTTGTQATYARDEYISTSTGSTGTLACNLRTRRWREVGLNVGSIHYASEIDKIAVHHVGSSSVYELEKEGQLDDNAVGISYVVETKHFNVPSQQEVLVRNVFVDYQCTRSVTFDLMYDWTSTKGYTFAGSAARRTAEIPCNIWTKDFGLRVAPTTTTTGDMKLYGIDFDVYIPDEERE
ncbi:MAG: LamG-like jellyroll fold domain-containing protein, partial [Candidatus Thorarchaeota archaeon]